MQYCWLDYIGENTKKITRKSLMRIVCLIALCCATCLPGAAFASDPDTGVIIKKVFDAASGEGKLLRLFRTRETVNVSSDIHRLSDWKEVDGVQYPAKCIGFKKNTEKPWYFSEILELERLNDLPGELKRR